MQFSYFLISLYTFPYDFPLFFYWLQIYTDKVLQRDPSAVSFYVFEGEERGEFVEMKNAHVGRLFRNYFNISFSSSMVISNKLSPM